MVDDFLACEHAQLDHMTDQNLPHFHIVQWRDIHEEEDNSFTYKVKTYSKATNLLRQEEFPCM